MKYLVPVALLSLAWSGLASAQAGTGQSVLSSVMPMTPIKAYAELQACGTCFARHQANQALALIATVPGSADETKAMNRYVYGEQDICLLAGTNMQVPAVFARGAIAEGLLRARGVPASHQLSIPPASEVGDLHAAARCYTAGHRQEVLAVLNTGLGTPQETKAVAAIWQDLRKCMPGLNVRLNAPWIRFLLAEALLRLPPAKIAG